MRSLRPPACQILPILLKRSEALGKSHALSVPASPPARWEHETYPIGVLSNQLRGHTWPPAWQGPHCTTQPPPALG